MKALTRYLAIFKCALLFLDDMRLKNLGVEGHEQWKKVLLISESRWQANNKKRYLVSVTLWAKLQCLISLLIVWYLPVPITGEWLDNLNCVNCLCSC